MNDAKYAYIVTPLKYAYTMLVVIIGWVLFRSSTLEQAFEFTQIMFGFGSVFATTMPGWYLPNSALIALALGFILSWPVTIPLLTAARKISAKIALKTTPIFSEALATFAVFIAMMLLLLLSVMMLTTRGSQPFIYAQF
jgi:alginate O-acetyltransferase complex protein AlgI